MDTTKFLITLPIDLKARLKEHAIEKGLNLNAYIRMILTEKERIKHGAHGAVSKSRDCDLPQTKVVSPKIDKTHGFNMGKDVLSEIKDLVKKVN